MHELSLTNIQKSFGDIQALKSVSFNILGGEVIALLGPSGCGKSTLLNIISGLENPDAGNITWNGESLLGQPSHKRGFGLMFQDYMLFPHKNVGANIAFGLKMAKWPKERIYARVNEMLESVGLTGYAQRDINTLSGGEQQRVALARSLAPRPRLLMLDEPLGALDRTLRERLLDELRDVLHSIQQTALYVTHDQEEAFSLADRVIVMDQGEVAQIGTPQAIYQQPASEFVASFLGLRNIVKGIIQDGVLKTEIGEFEIEKQMYRASSKALSIDPSSDLLVLIRQDAMRLYGSGAQQISGTLLETRFRGSICQSTIQVGKRTLIFEFPSTTPLPQIGKSVTLSFHPAEAIQILR